VLRMVLGNIFGPWNVLGTLMVGPFWSFIVSAPRMIE